MVIGVSKFMLCKFCGFDEALDALYCTDCGKPFYNIEWVEQFTYVDRNYKLNLSLRIVNRGAFPLKLIKLRSADSSTFLKFTDQGAIQGGKENVLTISLTWNGSVSAENPIENWVCECNLGDTKNIQLVLPKIFILPSPDIRVFANQIPLNENVSANENPRVPLSPSQGSQVNLNFQLLNDSITELLEFSLFSNDGIPIIQNQHPRFHLSGGSQTNSRLITPQNFKSLSCNITFSEEQLKQIKDDQEYELRLAFRGKTDDVVLRFRPYKLLIPNVEILLRRPTNIGYAFIGKTAIDEVDISPKRLIEDVGLLSLSQPQKRILTEDSLVQDAFKELADSDTPEIVWYIPKEKNRVKKIALIRVVSEDEDKYDEVLCRIRLSLNSKNIELGEYTLSEEKNRHEIDVKLPAFSESEKGLLTIQYVGVAKKKEYKVSIHVFNPKPFPFPVAVDFGTTNSCIAFSLPNKDNVGTQMFPPVTPQNTILAPIGDFNTENENIWIIPSMIEFNEDGRYHIGVCKSKFVYAQFKLHLDEEFITPSNYKGKDIKESPLKITTDYLTEMLRRAMEYLEERGIENCVLEKLVCSMPTTFSFHQRLKLKEAYSLALKKLGINSNRIRIREIDESMAAFLYERRVHLEQMLNEFKQRPILIMVYDFGGGTTDVTVNFAYFPKDQRNRKYLEIASGGNSQLGGEDITNQLAKELFKETNFETLENAERIKKLLGTRFEFGKDAYLKEKLNTQDPNVILNSLVVAFKRVSERLKIKVNEILEDVLEKTYQRLSRAQKDLNTPNQPIPLFVLLAGNAILFKDFDKLINLILRRLINQNPDYKSLLFLEKVIKIDQPKSCVAKGAYLTKGHEPDIERPYQPHRSYWLELPPDVIPSNKLRGYIRERNMYLLLVDEGTPRPFRRAINRNDIGLNTGGEYMIYQKHGVNLFVYTTWDLEDPKPSEKELDITLSADETFTLRWI